MKSLNISFLKSLFNKNKDEKSIEKIVFKAVKLATDLDPNTICSDKTRKDITEARVLISKFLFDHGYKHEEIAKSLNKHRSTIYHYLDLYNSRKKYESFENKDNIVKQELNKRIS